MFQPNGPQTRNEFNEVVRSLARPDQPLWLPWVAAAVGIEMGLEWFEESMKRLQTTPRVRTGGVWRGQWGAYGNREISTNELRALNRAWRSDLALYRNAVPSIRQLLLAIDTFVRTNSVPDLRRTTHSHSEGSGYDTPWHVAWRNGMAHLANTTQSGLAVLTTSQTPQNARTIFTHNLSHDLSRCLSVMAAGFPTAPFPWLLGRQYPPSWVPDPLTDPFGFYDFAGPEPTDFDYMGEWWSRFTARVPFDFGNPVVMAVGRRTVSGVEASESSIAYRGMQNLEQKGVRGAPSFVPSLPVAIIWSSVPGSLWSGTKPHFVPTSAVSEVRLSLQNLLALGDGHPFTSMGAVLRDLRFGQPGGITHDDALKVYTYLHNREVGRARGGPFVYRVLNEDGAEEDQPLSLSDTLLTFARDDFEANGLEAADRLEADTFIFADAPAVQSNALRMGFDGLVYSDVFQGAEEASMLLLGQPVRRLKGITVDFDIQAELVPTHQTIRPLDLTRVHEVRRIPAAEAVALVKAQA